MLIYTRLLISLSFLLGLSAGLPLLTRDTSSSSSTGNSEVTTDANSSKFVFAHHIIGNTFNFTPATWSSDVSLARTSGMDGFALNIGSQPWEPRQVKAAYDAAQSDGLGFKMFLSLDMSSLPCASKTDAQNLISLIRAQASHESQFLYGPGNKAFVSTFAGEKCTFSASSPSEGWAQHVISPLRSEIHFVPAFFVDPAQLLAGDSQGKKGFGGIIDGDFNWNSGWPIQLTTAALTKSASNPSALASLLNLDVSPPDPQLPLIPSPDPDDASPTTLILHLFKRALGHSFSLAGLAAALKSPESISDTARAAFAGVAGGFTSDQQHLRAIQPANLKDAGAPGVKNVQGMSSSIALKKTYMAAVSPWFFTHFSPQSFNKNFIFLSDNHLYSKRWENLVTMRDLVDLVEIATWNDYGESHYIGPIEGTQPNSQAWVDGHDHTGWLDITAYYAQAFKLGVYPTIEKDKIVMWARTHPRDAEASQDAVGRPTNFQLTEDSLWATVLVPAESNVTLSTAPSTNTTASNDASSTYTFSIPAGVSHLKAPLTPGGSMRASVSRGGETFLDFEPEGYKFNSDPRTFNFNAFVAASP